MERHLRSTRPAHPLPPAPARAVSASGAGARASLQAATTGADVSAAVGADVSAALGADVSAAVGADVSAALGADAGCPAGADVGPPPAAAVADTAAFAHAARVLAMEARRRGLLAPGFRSPPRLVGVDRSIRRHPNGAAVAVRVRNRPWVAVAADMIEGVIATNRLAPPRADRLRAELWSALGFAPAAAARPTTVRRHAA